MVVGGPADVGMHGPRARRRGLVVQGQTVQAVFEDRLDVAIRPRAGGERAGARGVEPLGAVLLRQPQDAQAGAIALLGMRPALEQRPGRAPRCGARWWRPSRSSARDSTPDARGAPSACGPGSSCDDRAR